MMGVVGTLLLILPMVLLALGLFWFRGRRG